MDILKCQGKYKVYLFVAEHFFKKKEKSLFLLGPVYPNTVGHPWVTI